jgi:hypothetical protein
VARGAVLTLRYVGLNFCSDQRGSRGHSGSMYIQTVAFHSTCLPRDGSPRNVKRSARSLITSYTHSYETLRGLSPQDNYTDRVIASCRRS